MSTRTDLPFDLIELLAEFAAADVEYLLVGGQALALHGRPRFTNDSDLWVNDTPENIARVRLALERFGAPADTIEGFERAQGLDVAWMGVPPTRIDLMKAVPGGDFARAWSSRVELDVGGVAVSVVGRDELARLKRNSGRPQDLIDADLLDRE